MSRARSGRRAGGTDAPPAGNARLAALRLLGRREYSTVELTRKLIERGHGADEVERTVATLAQERIVDDRRVAEAHVRTSTRIKGRGAVRIRRELEARGIRAALAQEVTSDLSADDQLGAIARLVTRKTAGKPPDVATRRRLFQQLLRRGFPADLITKALRYRPDDE
jgi:regulatory protein